MPPIPFNRFVDLLDKLSRTKPKANSAYPARDVLKEWLDDIRYEYGRDKHDLIPETTFLSILRLLLPEEDVRRKYHLQEFSIIKLLPDCLAIPDTLFKDWRAVEDDGVTCYEALGLKLEEILTKDNRSTAEPSSCHLSIQEVDDLLSELASMSPYSHESFRTTSTSNLSKNREGVLKKLYRPLTPRGACFVTQIILKVMAPVLYPSHGESDHYVSALRNSKKSQHIAPLTTIDFLNAWDPTKRLAKLSYTHAALEDLATLARCGPEEGVLIGSLITIHESKKGQGCKDTVKRLLATRQPNSTGPRHNRVWAETKYDGERCQIHVKCGEDGEPSITIYSKSGRDSTLDRAGIHGLIYDALNIQPPKSHYKYRSTARGTLNRPRLQGHVILDAEMVAYYSDKDIHYIDEYWRILSLVESTAQGVRGAQYRRTHQTSSDTQTDSEAEPPPCSQESMRTSHDSSSRHLALVFFDVLMVSSSSLLHTPYYKRRATLEQLIHEISHRVIVAERRLLDLSGGVREGERQLRKIFARALGRFDEGLMLKPEEGHYVYGSGNGPGWLKLKKDYIKGHGDSVDFVALGASWDQERGTILGVKPNVYTTLHMGTLANKKAMDLDPSIKPHFYMYFNVSWGLSRDALEDVNARVRGNAIDPLEDELGMRERSYTHDLFPGIAPPTVYFQEPLVAEVFGDRFSKDPGCKYYYPRHPRIEKIHRRNERIWQDTLPMKEMHLLARKAIGRDRSIKKEEDRTKIMFNDEELISPRIRNPSADEKRAREWLRKLELADGVEEEDYDVLEPGQREQPRGQKRKYLESISEGEESGVDHDSKDDTRGFIDHDSDDDTRGSIELQLSPTTPTMSSRHRPVASPMKPLKLGALAVQRATTSPTRSPVKPLKLGVIAAHRASTSPTRPNKLITPEIPMKSILNGPPVSPAKKARITAKPLSGSVKESKPPAPPIIHPQMLKKPVAWPSPRTSPMKPTPKRSLARGAIHTSSPRKAVAPLDLKNALLRPPMPHLDQGALYPETEPPMHKMAALESVESSNPQQILPPPPLPDECQEQTSLPTGPIVHLPPLQQDVLSGIPQLADLLNVSYMWSSPRLDPQLEGTLDAIADIHHRIHARSALWLGCGWGGTLMSDGDGRVEEYEPADWVQCGLVFVDSEKVERAVFAEVKRMEGVEELPLPPLRKPVLLLAAGVLDAVKITGHAEIEVAKYLLGVIE